MAQKRHKYDHEYKIQTFKLAKKIDDAKAAKELGFLKETSVFCSQPSEFSKNQRMIFIAIRRY